VQHRVLADLPGPETATGELWLVWRMRTGGWIKNARADLRQRPGPLSAVQKSSCRGAIQTAGWRGHPPFRLSRRDRTSQRTPEIEKLRAARARHYGVCIRSRTGPPAPGL